MKCIEQTGTTDTSGSRIAESACGFFGDSSGRAGGGIGVFVVEESSCEMDTASVDERFDVFLI